MLTPYRPHDQQRQPTHPLSALPLQFQADPEDDDYTREAKVQAVQQ